MGTLIYYIIIDDLLETMSGLHQVLIKFEF